MISRKRCEAFGGAVTVGQTMPLYGPQTRILLVMGTTDGTGGVLTMTAEQAEHLADTLNAYARDAREREAATAKGQQPIEATA